MTSHVREHVPQTGRHLDEVLLLHNLSAEQFAGKTVLDLGCGFSDLAGDLYERGVEAKVLGLEVNELQFVFPRREQPRTLRMIAHIGEPFPIADESIDIAIATYSFPMWAPSSEQVASFYNESKRVLKKDGLLSIYPICVAYSSIAENPPPSQTGGAIRSATNRRSADIRFSRNWESKSNDIRLVQAVKLG